MMLVSQLTCQLLFKTFGVFLSPAAQHTNIQQTLTKKYKKGKKICSLRSQATQILSTFENAFV